MPSLQVITLGCSKNTVDTEHLLFQVRDSYEIVPEGETRPVDVLLINTCGFIGDAKEQSIQVILEAAQRKKAGEVGRLLVFGCLSQRYPTELPDLIPEVDGWFGARELDPLVVTLGCKPDASQAHRRVRTDGLIVLDATFDLMESDPEKIRETMDDLTRRREEKQPLELPSAGSTFKRPEGHFAGKLIMDAGLKGYQVGGAAVSEKHAGFVVNLGGATAADVHAVIAHVQDEVKRQFDVELEPEVQFLG